MEDTLSSYNWEEIQKKHIDGYNLNQIYQEYNITRRLLNKAIKEGLFKKYNIKYICSDKTKDKLRKKRIIYLKNNPDKHPWRKKNKQISVPCEKIKDKLLSNNISYIEEYQPLNNRFFSIDIAFPDKKIGLEINGNQHYNSDGSLKEYYQNRHDLIESNGWKIYELHYSLAYNDEYIDIIINHLKYNYNLENIDYSPYIKEKVKKRTRKEYFDIKNDKFDSEQKEYIDKVLKSDIDFSKYGWVSKISKIINKKPQKVNKWMKRYMNDFYINNCFKKNK